MQNTLHNYSGFQNRLFDSKSDDNILHITNLVCLLLISSLQCTSDTQKKLVADVSKLLESLCASRICRNDTEN